MPKLASPLPFDPSTFPRHCIPVYTRPALSAPPPSPIALKLPLSSSHRERRWHTSFIVDDRWMTNDGKPTEADRGFIIYVYTAPLKSVLP